MKDSVQQTNTEKLWYLLEKQQPFSKLLLWDLQQHYFTIKGVDAWRRAEVPYYLTSNPTMANSYAEIVFAFLCEQQRLAPVDGEGDEPLYLCEPGGGSVPEPLRPQCSD
jgi:hypothetical protein